MSPWSKLVTRFSRSTEVQSRSSAPKLRHRVAFLRPTHRVHAPVGGRIVGWQHVPGCLFSVNRANLRREPGLFARNERLVVLINGDTSGQYACVMVAAFGVGNITLACDPEVETHRRRFSDGSVRTKRFVSPPRIERGDELGIFHMGSTVISVFSPGRIELYPVCSGQLLRLGHAIGRGRASQPDLAASVTQ
jgi:phosphatidylserine decarboxylase